LPLPEVDIPRAVAALAAAGRKIGGVQLDGWWMNQTTFAPDNTLFPSSWPVFQQRLRSAGDGTVPLLLYKAFFSGNYDLFAALNVTPVLSPTGAHYPDGPGAFRFFRALFQQGLGLGMASFETDFMSDHLLPTPALSNNTQGLPLYLSGMAAAGAALNTPMQWCMPTAGLVLFAANLSAVTNARASVDYACEGPQAMNVSWAPNYMIGIPGLLFFAADVTPSKDIFWTRAEEKGAPVNCGPAAHGQPNFEMDAVLAVLSTGPVGLGDGVSLTNISLANRTSRADGVVLKPDKPLTALDPTFMPHAGPRPNVGFLPMTAEGECSFSRPCSPAAHQTHATVNITTAANGEDGAATWHQLLSINLGAFNATLRDLYPQPACSAGQAELAWYVRESRFSSCMNNSVATAALPRGGYCLRRIAVPCGAVDTPFLDITSGQHRLDGAGALAWALYNFAPELPSKWTLLGEREKIVPVSSLRFTDVQEATTTDDSVCLAFRMHATAHEVVAVGAVDPAGIYVENVFAGSDCPAGQRGPVCRICPSTSQGAAMQLGRGLGLDPAVRSPSF
jgi:hypothetical protein